MAIYYYTVNYKGYNMYFDFNADRKLYLDGYDFDWLEKRVRDPIPDNDYLQKWECGIDSDTSFFKRANRDEKNVDSEYFSGLDGGIFNRY
jgi:hypothetical protein